MRRTILIMCILLGFAAAGSAQYITPRGISPLANPPLPHAGPVQISSLSLGGISSTASQSELFSLGLQQILTGIYIPCWDTLDISELLEFSIQNETPLHYFLEARELGEGARFEIHPDGRLMGEYSWDEDLDLFSFVPDLGNAEFCDTVVFLAILGEDTIRREIHFTYLPRLPLEDHALGLAKAGSGDDGLMNEISVLTDPADSTLYMAGRILSFDRENDDRGLCDYAAQGDADRRFEGIRRVVIYADSLSIKDPLHFPSCEVSIYARWLVFEGPVGAINTTPYSEAVIHPDSTAAAEGKNAGDIYLFTGDVSMGPGHHFIMNGGDGQSVTVGAGVQPGNGGNGGDIISPVYIAATNVSSLPGAPGDNGTGASWGERGTLVPVDWYPSIWVHARNIQPTLNYLRMQYMENNLACVREGCAMLDALLTEKFAALDTASGPDEADLMNTHNEVREMRNRLRRQRDYYGNPVGWVPLLSFEVYKGVFEGEVDNAFNLMYLSYLINKADANIVQAKKGMELTRSSMIEEVESLQENLNDNIQKLEVYENIYDRLKVEVDSLREELKVLEERLLKEAEENARTARFLSVFQSIASVGGSILSVIPHPACQVVGQGLSVVGELNLEDPFSLENASLLVEASANAYGSYKDYKKETINKIGTDNQLKSLTGISQEEIDDIDKGLDRWNTMNKTAQKLIDYASDYDKSASTLEVGDKYVQAELDKLKAASHEYKRLTAAIDRTVKKQKEMHEKIAFTMNAISSDMNRVAGNRLAIQALTKSIQDESAKRDLRTLQYANSIEKRAFERLQNYHYLMTRAFEYRTLMPWTQPLNLEGIRQGMMNYVLDLSDTATNVTVPREQFDAIKGIYMDQLHEVADSILANFESGGFTKNRSTSFELDKEELDQLNRGEELYINPHKRNLFGLDKENVRIQNIGAVSIELEDGTVLSGGLDESRRKSARAAPFEIVMEHSGYSKLQSSGKVYYFNHNRVGSVKYEWRSNIDITGDRITQDRISNSDKSLLHSLIDNLSDSELSFTSAPSAWADISLKRISGGENRKIISMVLEISFDYKVLSPDLHMLKVETDGDVSPYYLLSAEDLNGFKDGKGDFTRAYAEASVVAITAQNRYGNHVFRQWDQVSLSGVGGRSMLTSSVTAGIITNEHTHLIAVYETLDSVWFVTPGQGQWFQPGRMLSIQWDQTIEHDMRLDLYLDGFFLTTICDSVMGRAYDWQVPQDFTVPQHHEGDFRLKISSRLDPALNARSESLSFYGTAIPQKTADELGLLLYPNPVREELWIGLPQLRHAIDAEFCLYSVDGRLFRRELIHLQDGNDRVLISTEGLVAGTYIVNLRSGGALYMERIIVE